MRSNAISSTTKPSSPTDNCAGGVPPAAAFLFAVAALQTLVSAALDVGAAFRDRPRQPSHETVKGNKP